MQTRVDLGILLQKMKKTASVCVPEKQGTDKYLFSVDFKNVEFDIIQAFVVKGIFQLILNIV